MPTKITRDRGRRRRAAAVAAHRAKHGDWCPGFERGGHGTRDLTADHVTGLAAGGDEFGPLAVLCRSCNSRKARRAQLAADPSQRREPNRRSNGRRTPWGVPPRDP